MNDITTILGPEAAVLVLSGRMKSIAVLITIVKLYNGHPNNGIQYIPYI